MMFFCLNMNASMNAFWDMLRIQPSYPIFHFHHQDVLTGKSKKYAASPNAMQAVERANVDNAMIIDERDIRLLDQIGEGAHGVVYEGKWESSNGQVGFLASVDNDLFHKISANSCCKGTKRQ